MRAVILAAGEGSRLRPYTDDRPKCLVELGGATLLERQVAILRSRGVDDVRVVTGYHAEQIERLGLPTHHNPDYAHSNMVESLMCAAAALDGSDDVVIGYGDIVYEPRVLDALCASPAPLSTVIDRSWLDLWKLRHEDPLDDAETLRMDPSGNILELGRRPRRLDEIQGQYIGLSLARAAAAAELVRFHAELDPEGPHDGRDRRNMYMTSFLQRWIDAGRTLVAATVEGGWLEIDSASDLELYRSLRETGRLAELCDLGDPV